MWRELEETLGETREEHERIVRCPRCGSLRFPDKCRRCGLTGMYHKEELGWHA